ncbi:MAG: hypothetical protein LAO31_19660 [Acidobacteriia bacterium]|nr:hypothetical protein [Terriglobia bacterium]
MNYKIVCVGGTGQMVLHYYLQLYLLGVIDHPFDAVIIDTDEITGSLQAAQSFLSDLQYGPQKNQALGTKIPLIAMLRVRPQGKDTALQALTGRSTCPSLHPAHAFFNDDTLSQNLMQGLFARPSLSAVVSLASLQDDTLTPEPDSTVVLVCSVLGGTGGGLAAPLIDLIRQRVRKANIKNVRIRAVFFGEYFTPNQQKIHGAVERFQSNRTLVLRSIQEAMQEVHSFYIVGGPHSDTSFEKRPEEEKKGAHIPWPIVEQHPYWEGAKALEFLLTDTTTETKPSFVEREIYSFDPPFTLQAAKKSLEQRLHVVGKLIHKQAIVRMSKDPWAGMIWGEPLVNTVGHFWSIAAKVQGGKDRVKGFPLEVQRRLEFIWGGQDGRQSGLEVVFPEITESYTVAPKSIRHISWPNIEQATWNKGIFEGVGMAAHKAAATLLYRSLREGV